MVELIICANEERLRGDGPTLGGRHLDLQFMARKIREGGFSVIDRYRRAWRLWEGKLEGVVAHMNDLVGDIASGRFRCGCQLDFWCKRIGASINDFSTGTQPMLCDRNGLPVACQ